MKIIYKNQEIEVQIGTTIREALKEEIAKGEIREVIAARFNNSIESLNFPIEKDGEIELFNRQDRDGREIWFSNDFNSFDNYSYNIENEGGEEHNDKRTLIFSVKRFIS